MAEAKELGNTLREVTDSIVGIHREFYGRGATRGRTIMQGNHLVTFMEDIYTKAEKTLIESGNFNSVHRARNDFQGAMRTRFVEAVERHTGRTVTGFLSQVGTNPDISLEAFWLEPNQDGDGDGR